MILPGAPDLQPVAPGRFVVTLDACWNQGPGIYGGLLAATLVRAAELAYPGWPVRAVSLHLCATTPPGSVDVELVEQRRGTRTVFLSVRLLSGGLPTVVGSLTLGRARAVDADFERARPPVLPPPESVPDVFASGGRPPGIPVFTDHFDFRLIDGAPFSGQAAAVGRGWIRPRLPARLDAPLVLGLIDAWPLALIATFPRARPASSVVIHTQILHPLPAAGPQAFYAVDMETDVNRQGYADQRTSLFDRQGALLARCTQLVAVIR